MSERGRDVLHYSRPGPDQHARRVSPDALTFTDLTVRHGDVLAVDGLDLHVGEVLHLVRRSYPNPWPLDDLVATTGIGGLLGRDVDALSGGQRQRVLLA